MKRIGWILLAAALAWWGWRNLGTPPARSAAAAGNPASTRRQPEPDPAWSNKLRTTLDDETIRAFMAAGLPRERMIGTLLGLLAGMEPSGQMTVLDLLAALQPIEATDRLTRMLKETRDPQLAVKLLQTLRAATLVTTDGGRVDFEDPQLPAAFEAIQATFREELNLPASDPARFRAAVAAIADVFPRDEALERFKSLESGLPLPLTEMELYGRWLEFLVGDVEGRDFQQVAAFIRDHPAAVADEGTKARVIALLGTTPIREDETDAVVALIGQLEPGEAPDDSWVRWLELKSRLTGPVDPATLLRSASPMRKAALIHFADLNPDPNEGEALRRELNAAARQLPESEERDFMESAAAAIPGR